MHDNHGLILIESEMYDLLQVVSDMKMSFLPELPNGKLKLEHLQPPGFLSKHLYRILK